MFVFESGMWASRIARKLITQIIVFSAFIALIMTLFQFSVDYRQDKKKIEEKIEDIRMTQLDTFRYSVWNLDEETIKRLLDSLLKIEGFEYLKVSTDQKVFWEVGRVKSQNIISRTFPIYHSAAGEMLIGELTVVAGLDPIHKLLMNRGLIILAGNTVKTFLVAFFALAVFQMLVSRHLQRIATYVHQMGNENYEKELCLDGKKSSVKYPDEIDRIVTAINSMRLEQKTLIDGLKNEIQIRTQAEASLRKSEERFKAMADTSPLAIYLSAGIEQKAKYINPTFTRLFGYGMDEVPSVEQWWPLAYPDEIYRREISEEWQRRVAHAMATRSETDQMETMVTCKDGSCKNILWGFKTMGDENWAFGLDLTERKQAEAALKESESMFRALADQSITGIYMFQESRFLYVNQRFCEIFGYSEEEILTSLKPTDVVAPEEVRNAEDRIQARLSGLVKNAHYTARGRRKDGAELWVDIYGTRINRQGVPTITGTVLDITERRQAEKKSIEQLKELTRWHDALVGREDRIIEIKQEVNELLARLGEPMRYPSATEKALEDTLQRPIK